MSIFMLLGKSLAFDNDKTSLHFYQIMLHSNEISELSGFETFVYNVMHEAEYMCTLLLWNGLHPIAVAKNRIMKLHEGPMDETLMC